MFPEISSVYTNNTRSWLFSVWRWYLHTHKSKQIRGWARKALLRRVRVKKALHKVQVHIDWGHLPITIRSIRGTLQGKTITQHQLGFDTGIKFAAENLIWHKCKYGISVLLVSQHWQVNLDTQIELGYLREQKCTNKSHDLFYIYLLIYPWIVLFLPLTGKKRCIQLNDRPHGFGQFVKHIWYSTSQLMWLYVLEQRMIYWRPCMFMAWYNILVTLTTKDY